MKELKLNTKNIYNSLKDFEYDTGIPVGFSIYHDIRWYLFKNYALDDTIHVLFLGKYILIKYKDYNNFNWDLDACKTFSGGLSDMNPIITKLLPGLLLITRQDNGKLYRYTKINREDWKELEFTVNNGSVVATEIITNIFYYEYIKDKTIIMNLNVNENENNYLTIEGVDDENN